MIVDFHTHIIPPFLRENRSKYLHLDSTFRQMYSSPHSKSSTAEELVRAMDVAGVDIAVAMGPGWESYELSRQANDYIIESAHRFPGRLIGFCSVNPTWGDLAVNELERCTAKGVRGVGELHPDTQGFDISDIQAMASIMKACQRLALIVLSHASEPVGHLYPGKGKTTPEKLYKFVSQFPENTIVLAHFGGGLPLYALMPEVKQALAKVHFDSAATPYLYTKSIYTTVASILGPEHVLFGSDYPLLGLERPLAYLQGSGLSEKDKGLVLGLNAARLLGLD